MSESSRSGCYRYSMNFVYTCPKIIKLLVRIKTALPLLVFSTNIYGTYSPRTLLWISHIACILKDYFVLITAWLPNSVLLTFACENTVCRSVDSSRTLPHQTSISNYWRCTALLKESKLCPSLLRVIRGL